MPAPDTAKTRPQAIFWDIDGTLADSEPWHAHALTKTLQQLGVTPPPDLHDRIVGQSANAVFELMRREFNLSTSFENWIRLKYKFYLESVPNVKPRDGAVEMFDAARRAGIRQAVVSNSDRLIVDANLRTIGIAEPGLISISRNDVRKPKPSPEPYLRAAWLIDVAPDCAVVIEDSATGATAGRSAGCRTILWPQTPQATIDGVSFARTCLDVADFLGLRSANP